MPSGRVGTFAGTCRIDHIVSNRGTVHVRAVLSGLLRDADGSRIGTYRRRQETFAEMIRQTEEVRVLVEPAEIAVNGVLVHLQQVEVWLPTSGRDQA